MSGRRPSSGDGGTAIDAADGVGIGINGMEAIGAADGAGIVPYGMEAVGAADGAGIGLPGNHIGVVAESLPGRADAGSALLCPTQERPTLSTSQLLLEDTNVKYQSLHRWQRQPELCARCHVTQQE